MLDVLLTLKNDIVLQLPTSFYIANHISISLHAFNMKLSTFVVGIIALAAGTTFAAPVGNVNSAAVVARAEDCVDCYFPIVYKARSTDSLEEKGEECVDCYFPLIYKMVHGIAEALKKREEECVDCYFPIVYKKAREVTEALAGRL
jgi:hypothetical protein